MEALIIVVVIVVVAAVGVAAAFVWTRRRSAHLKEQFGTEYERTVESAGDQSSAERELRDREKRRSRFEVRPLSAEATTRYRREWEQVQMRFVDEPGRAVEEADSLVVRIMRERGYPVDHFDQRADDISVDHPDVVQHYREAHGVAVAHTRDEADTEQLRQAVTSYRSLVDSLLDGAAADEGSATNRDTGDTAGDPDADTGTAGSDPDTKQGRTEESADMQEER